MTYEDLEHERARVELAYALAAQAWEMAQHDYRTAIAAIAQQRGPLLAERILSLEKEIAALRLELPQIDGQGFSCPYCPHISPTKRGFSVQLQRKHPEYWTPTPPPKTKATCPTCGKAFARLASHYYMKPECNPAYHAAAESRRQASLVAQAAKDADKRRRAAMAQADNSYRIASEADLTITRFVCKTCRSDAHAPSLTHPGICVRCAARNGVEVAA